MALRSDDALVLSIKGRVGRTARDDDAEDAAWEGREIVDRDAATATAQSSRNACAPIQPFYWEVGDASARLGSGSVPSNAGAPTYTGSTVMAIASASKWVSAATLMTSTVLSTTATTGSWALLRSRWVRAWPAVSRSTRILSA